ncbi:MAG: hypothetical protein WC686_01870 [Candidatus Shapirobacteria bacterium]|jgi:hypothetical protein
MPAKTILQVPVDIKLKKKATMAAESLGFSSLQESVRVFLVQLSHGQVKLSFGPPCPPANPPAH